MSRIIMGVGVRVCVSRMVISLMESAFISPFILVLLLSMFL